MKPLSFEAFLIQIGTREGQKFNSCHDNLGQFCSTGGGASTLPPFDYVAQLDDEVKKSIVGYSFVDYKPLNKGLRAGNSLTEKESKIVSDIDKAIRESSPVKPTKVYRAVQASPEQMGMEVGKVFQDKAYLSTTSDASYMYKLAGENSLKTRITIKVPSGSQGLQIEKISKKPKEKEVLFARNSKLKITKITKDEFGNTDVTAELVQ